MRKGKQGLIIFVIIAMVMTSFVFRAPQVLANSDMNSNEIIVSDLNHEIAPIQNDEETQLPVLGEKIAAPAIVNHEVAPGTAESTTEVTATVEVGNSLSVEISSSSISTPFVGDEPTSGQMLPYTSGSDLGGVDPNLNKYVGLYELDSSGKIVRFSLLTLQSGDINIPLKVVPLMQSLINQPYATVLQVEEMDSTDFSMGEVLPDIKFDFLDQNGNLVVERNSTDHDDMIRITATDQDANNINITYSSNIENGIATVSGLYFPNDWQGVATLVFTAWSGYEQEMLSQSIHVNVLEREVITLGGESNPLYIVLKDTGEILPYALQNEEYVAQYYGGDSLGTNVFYTDETGASFHYVTPYYEKGGAISLGKGKLTKTDANTVELEWILDDGNLKLIQTVHYTPGEGIYEKNWSFLNVSTGKIYSDMRLIHGGDTYFGGQDEANAAWNEEFNMIYIRNREMNKYGIMGFYGSEATPADHYFGGLYWEGVNQAFNGNLLDMINNGSTDNGFEDAGYQLQWNRESLMAGESWKVVSYERWTGPGSVQVISPESKETEPGHTIAYKFVVQNLLAKDDGSSVPASFHLTAVSEHGWDTAIRGNQTIELLGGGAKVVWVDVTVPVDTSVVRGELTFTATAATDELPEPMPVGSGKVTTIVSKINTVPTVSDVLITGLAQVGQILTGNYIYYDAENDLQGVSTFKWYRSDTAEGLNTIEISGETANTYTLMQQDIGKYISYEVTPVALTGTLVGNPAKSVKTSIVSQTPTPPIVTPEPTPPTVTPAPTPSSVAPSSSSSSSEEITVDLESGNKGNIVFKTKLIRETASDGTKKDRITLQSNDVEEALAKAKALGSNTIRIMIPDTSDLVSEVRVDIPRAALELLKDGKIDLELFTENMRIVIPGTTLSTITEDDFYFRFLPVKEVSKQKEIERRVQKEEIIKQITGSTDIQIMGRPMVIETNMENHPIILYMPLNTGLPTDPSARQKQLDNSGVYIEHDDGTKELVKGELSEYKNGVQGIRFETKKFSTFTMIHMEGLNAYFAKQDEGQHEAYINGFLDGTFRSETAVSRSEMATMLSRNLPVTSVEGTTFFKDISSNHWAYDEIISTSNQGILVGFKDGYFRPKQSVTRAEMAAIVSRWLIKACTADSLAYTNCSTIDVIDGTTAFKDVSSTHWALQAIQLAASANVMTGSTDGVFRPDDAITRAEAVKVLNRLFNRGPIYGDLNPSFPDVPSTYWAFREIEEAARSHAWVKDAGKEMIKSGQ